jgi:hypothetical protein
MVTDSLWEKMKLAVQTLYGWVDPDHQLNDSSAKFHGMGLHHAQFTKYRNLANGCLNAYFLLIATKVINAGDEIVICCDHASVHASMFIAHDGDD